MSSVPRATFDAFKSDLDAEVIETIHDFASKRDLAYDPAAVRAQCAWADDAIVDVLMFGLDVFPADSDDDDGEPMIPTPLPVNDTVSRPRLAMAAGLLLALTAGMWASTAADEVEATSSPTRSFVHDATLPVTLSSSILPDAVG